MTTASGFEVWFEQFWEADAKKQGISSKSGFLCSKGDERKICHAAFIAGQTEGERTLDPNCMYRGLVAWQAMTGLTTAQSLARDQVTQQEFDAANLARYLPAILLTALVMAGVIMWWEAWRKRR